MLPSKELYAIGVPFVGKKSIGIFKLALFLLSLPLKWNLLEKINGSILFNK
jgi:hypothetical protein